MDLRRLAQFVTRRSADDDVGVVLLVGALEARRSGDRDGFATKVEAAELLGEQSDGAMLRLEAPVCAAE